MRREQFRCRRAWRVAMCAGASAVCRAAGGAGREEESGTASSRRRRRRAARRRSSAPARAATTSSSPARSAARRSRATCSGRSTTTTTSPALFTFIRDTMPQDGPSLVNDEIKADILAYIMSVNGMPAGNDELKADVRALDEIKIAKKTTCDGVFTEAQAERGKAELPDGTLRRVPQARPDGRSRSGAQGRRLPGALGERQRRDALRQDPRDDAAQLAERDDRRREDRHRGLPAAAERLSRRARAELRAEADSLGIIDLVRKGQTQRRFRTSRWCRWSAA